MKESEKQPAVHKEQIMAPKKGRCRHRPL